MSRVFLGLGSNVEPRHNLRSGIRALRDSFGRIRLSPTYETEAVGFEGNAFLNLAAEIETDMGPLALKNLLNRLEKSFGRARNVPKFSDRTLDIDILLYDDLYLLAPQLQIPRDEITRYAHVLKPLADIAGEVIHPSLDRPIGDLWLELEPHAPALKPVSEDFETESGK